MINIKNNLGQAMIWAVVAIAIIGVIILFFAVNRKEATVTTSKDTTIQLDLKQCVSKATGLRADALLERGGFGSGISFLYKGKNISFLCYTEGFYKPCVQQHSLLVREVTSSFKGALRSEIEECFSEAIYDLQRRNIAVEEGALSYSVELIPGSIRIAITKSLILRSNDQTQTIKGFIIDVQHPAYELVSVAAEIASQEAKFCNFEVNGYSLLHAELSVVVDRFDGVKAYTLVDKKTEKKMQFAIRGCAIPAGL